MARVVSRGDLEAGLQRLRDQVADPNAGIHGPGTLSWQISRESAVFLGAGRAALLQLAHPYVAYAIDEHSDTRRDPIGRFNRTFSNVYAMVFGELEQACDAARHVHTIHARIGGRIGENVGRFRRGDAYRANDPDALLWVHATLVETTVMVYERIVRRLTSAEKERFYAESKRFAMLFGIPDAIVPATWTDFVGYCQRMYASDTLVVSEPAAVIARFLMFPRRAAVWPMFRWYRAITAGLMPPRLRHAFGLSWEAADRAVFRSTMALAHAGYPRLPRRLRDVPAYVEAQRRLAGRARDDRFGRAVERGILAVLRPGR